MLGYEDEESYGYDEEEVELRVVYTTEPELEPEPAAAATGAVDAVVADVVLTLREEPVSCVGNAYVLPRLRVVVLVVPYADNDLVGVAAIVVVVASETEVEKEELEFNPLPLVNTPPVVAVVEVVPRGILRVRGMDSTVEGEEIVRVVVLVPLPSVVCVWGRRLRSSDENCPSVVVVAVVGTTLLLELVVDRRDVDDEVVGTAVADL